MSEISLDDLFSLYKETISKCGTYWIEADDLTLECNVFEVFDIGVTSFLH